MWNETNDICLMFAGETYAERAALAQLRHQDQQFDAENATYPVHLYEEMGLKFLDRRYTRESHRALTGTLLHRTLIEQHV